MHNFAEAAARKHCIMLSWQSENGEEMEGRKMREAVSLDGSEICGWGDTNAKMRLRGLTLPIVLVLLKIWGSLTMFGLPWENQKRLKKCGFLGALAWASQFCDWCAQQSRSWLRLQRSRSRWKRVFRSFDALRYWAALAQYALTLSLWSLSVHFTHKWGTEDNRGIQWQYVAMLEYLIWLSCLQLDLRWGPQMKRLTETCQYSTRLPQNDTAMLTWKSCFSGAENESRVSCNFGSTQWIISRMIANENGWWGRGNGSGVSKFAGICVNVICMNYECVYVGVADYYEYVVFIYSIRMYHTVEVQ